MKQVLTLIAVLIGITAFSQGNWTLTGTRNRWGNGMGFSSKSASQLDAFTNASDSNLVQWSREDSTLAIRGSIYAPWRKLSHSTSGDFIRNQIGGNLSAQAAKFYITDTGWAAKLLRSNKGLIDSIQASSSAGGYLVTNGGAAVMHWGGGGSVEVDFKGFAGYDANRSSSYTARSFTDKGYVDSSFLAYTTLQNAYNNSSIPNITTNTTNRAVSIQRGTGADTDSVFVVRNGAGTVTSAITGDGRVLANKVNANDTIRTSGVLRAQTARIEGNLTVLGSNATVNSLFAGGIGGGVFLGTNSALWVDQNASPGTYRSVIGTNFTDSITVGGTSIPMIFSAPSPMKFVSGSFRQQMPLGNGTLALQGDTTGFGTKFIYNQTGSNLSAQTAKFWISDTIRTSGYILGSNLLTVSATSAQALSGNNTSTGRGLFAQALTNNAAFLQNTSNDSSAARIVNNGNAEIASFENSFGDVAAIGNDGGLQQFNQGSGFWGRTLPTTLSANRTWNLPNASGTIALTSNVTDSSSALRAAINTKLNISDTAGMLANRLKISDTLTMLSPYARKDQLSDSIIWGNISGSLNNQTDLRDTLATKQRKIAVSVKDFGALGDSTTNDYNAIQAAINYAVSSGLYWVHFPNGKYLVGQTINVPSFVKITGESIRRPIIFGNFSGTLISLNGEGIKLEDLLFDQAGALAGTSGRTGNAIDIIGTNSVNTSWTQLSSVEAISNNKVVNIDASASSTQRGDIAIYNSSFFHYGATDTGFIVKNTRYVSIVNTSLFTGGSSSGCRLYSDANSPFLKVSSNAITGVVEVNGESSSFYGANFGSQVTINSSHITVSGGSTSGNFIVNGDSCIVAVSLIGSATITDNGSKNSIYSRYAKTDRLGINTTPTQAIDVLIPAATQDGIIVTNASTFNNWHGINSSNVGFDGSTNATPYQTQTNGVRVMYHDTNQNTGFGNSSPTAKVDITGDLKVSSTTRFSSRLFGTSLNLNKDSVATSSAGSVLPLGIDTATGNVVKYSTPSGTYTPTITDAVSSGVTAITARISRYVRVGNNVTVFGSFDATDVVGFSAVYITLPIASTLSTIYDLSGNLSSTSTTPTGMSVRGASNAGIWYAIAEWVGNTSAAKTFSFSFMYEVK